MAVTTPKTDWATGELVTAADMNAIGENLAELAVSPAVASHETPNDHESYANDWADIDSDNFNLTLTTNGGDVLAGFQGAIHRAGDGTTVNIDVEVDGPG